MSSRPAPSLAQAGCVHWKCPLYGEEEERMMEEIGECGE